MRMAGMGGVIAVRRSDNLSINARSLEENVSRLLARLPRCAASPPPSEAGPRVFLLPLPGMHSASIEDYSTEGLSIRYNISQSLSSNKVIKSKFMLINMEGRSIAEDNIGSKKIIENNGGQFENALAIDGSGVKKL